MRRPVPSVALPTNQASIAVEFVRGADLIVTGLEMHAEGTRLQAEITAHNAADRSAPGYAEESARLTAARSDFESRARKLIDGGLKPACQRMDMINASRRDGAARAAERAENGV